MLTYRHRPLAERARTTVKMGWSDPSWKWGSAGGEAHNEAAKVRSALATREARAKFIQATSKGACSLDDAKMALALSCQRARNFGYDTDAGLRNRWAFGGMWESLMEEMAACKFEGGRGEEALAEAIWERLELS